MKKLAIIGSGDLGQQIAHHCKADNQFDLVGFFDDFKSTDESVNNLPILGGLNDILTCYNSDKFDFILIGIGYKHMDFRTKLYNELKDKIPFAKFIHSSCHIDPSAEISEGCVLFPGCLLDQHVQLAPNCLLNVNCSISHHSTIGAHSFLSPRVAIAGFVSVEAGCIIGINSTIIDNISIASGTQIGGAGIVIKDIIKQGLYVGHPVRFIR